MSQGVLPFKYEAETGSSKATALGGLPTYLELAQRLGLLESIDKQLQERAKGQGWTDRQLVTSLVMLNLAGGDCVDDLRVLQGDAGFSEILKRVELHGVSRQERRTLLQRWRKQRTRTVPSPSSVFRYLDKFSVDEAERGKRTAWIPTPTNALVALRLVNRDFVAGLQKAHPQTTATLDCDATLVETMKKNALFCYKGFPAYQPLNIYWAEQDVVLHSEFREGNVPAGYQQLRVIQEALTYLPEGVSKVYIRTDSAGYEASLLRYLSRGDDPRFGVIEFAISADVTPEFRTAVATLAPSDWKRLYDTVKGPSGTLIQKPTLQEYAEVCFVPNWLGHSKNNPELRYIAIRELCNEADQLRFPGMEAEQLELPFPVMEVEGKRYKLHGMVTNRLQMPADQLIFWQRERCGKSEEAHAVFKDDLAGGKLPTDTFGANAAWWAIMILAFNLNSAMKRLVLGDAWVGRRLKAIRFHFICVAGRVIHHARQLIIRINAGHPSLELLLGARRRLLCPD